MGTNPKKPLSGTWKRQERGEKVLELWKENFRVPIFSRDAALDSSGSGIY